MRVLNVKANMHPVWGGGTAERTFQMSRALADRAGVEVTLLTLDLGLTPEWHRAMSGVEVAALPCLGRRYQLPAVPPRKIGRLVRSADVIHLMGHWTLLNALVYRQAMRLGVPYVVCPAGTLRIFGRSRFLKRLYNLAAGNGILRCAARHIAITRDELPQLRAYGVEEGSVRVIPNGIRPSEYQYRDDAGFRRRFELDDAPFLLFLGRLNPIKGPDLLIEAFASVKDRFPRHNLVMAGQDEGMGRLLAELARSRGLEQRVRFIGFIYGREKSMAYHAADLLVIPSRHEAMSIVVLESGAAGTPVVVTDQCGLGEVARIGGGLVVPATVEGVARGIEEALETPDGETPDGGVPDRLALMGERLKAYTLERFSWDSIGQRFVDLFHEVLGERRTPAGAGNENRNMRHVQGDG